SLIPLDFLLLAVARRMRDVDPALDQKMHRPVEVANGAELSPVAMADQADRVLDMLKPVSREASIHVAAEQDRLAGEGAALGGDVQAADRVLGTARPGNKAVLEPAPSNVDVAPPLCRLAPIAFPAARGRVGIVFQQDGDVAELDREQIEERPVLVPGNSPVSARRDRDAPPPQPVRRAVLRSIIPHNQTTRLPRAREHPLDRPVHDLPAIEGDDAYSEPRSHGAGYP